MPLRRGGSSRSCTDVMVRVMLIAWAAVVYGVYWWGYLG